MRAHVDVFNVAPSRRLILIYRLFKPGGSNTQSRNMILEAVSGPHDIVDVSSESPNKALEFTPYNHKSNRHC